ncbi:esterase FrsA [Tatumella saanichensis]|uniref:esterase FrsA n=1 Tax=Tatumella saanichensis TaxID=480813 RepID=UPI0004A464DC|nr:esterase FrsA [Tatumella saanichensis]
MQKKNLSEELFKPRFEHPETSTLVQPLCAPAAGTGHSATTGLWYRTLLPFHWHFRGVPPLETKEVLSRIAASRLTRTSEQQLDTVRGYRNGNWIYEWSRQAALWQERALQETAADAAAYGLHAAALFSIAAYPHLSGDELSDHAQALGYRAFEQAMERSATCVKKLNLEVGSGKKVMAFLFLPAQAGGPYPTVMMCGGLDTLQYDHFHLFKQYLAPRGLAMLTLDMPSVGYSARWRLTQDTSWLHQQVLQQLASIPWIDSRRVALWGHRFGANVAVRLAYLESARLRAVACQAPIVHSLLTDPLLQRQVPLMFMDMLASRLGKNYRDDSMLANELSAFSLKNQGLLGRRTTVPLLSVSVAEDPFSPPSESELIRRSSSAGQMISLSAHPEMTCWLKCLAQTSNWLGQQLKGS